MAASARPMASVLLPEPPFWVANTIVCIINPLDSYLGGRWLRHTSRNRILRCRAMLAQTCPARSKGHLKSLGDRGRPNQNNAMMPDYKIVAIPYDYWRNSA